MLVKPGAVMSWKTVLAVCAVAFVARLALANGSAGPGGDPSSDAARVQLAATRGIVVHQELGLLPGNSAGQLRPVPALGDKGAWTTPTKVSLHTIRAQDSSLLMTVFADATTVRAREETALDNVLQAQASGDIELYGAGVSRVEYSKVRIDGTHATTVSRVETWSHLSMRAGMQEAVPVNILVVTTTLTRAHGDWVITDLTWTFDSSTSP
jgi:hypothetical protein